MDKHNSETSDQEMKKVEEKEKEELDKTLPKNGTEKESSQDKTEEEEEEKEEEGGETVNKKSNGKQEKSNGKQENSESPEEGDSENKESPKKEGSKEKDSVSVDKITVEDGSEILVTLNPEESAEQKENKSDKSSSEEGKKDKTVIKLTEEDEDVQFLSEENIGRSGKAVEINLAENSLRDIAKQNSSPNNNWNKNGQCQMNNNKQNNSLPNSYGNVNSKTPTYPSPMSQQHTPNTPYTPVLGSNSLNKSGFASCSSSSPFSPNLNDTDDGRDLAPTSSVQQIEAIKRETLLHSMSVKMQRILKERAKAELLKKVDEPLGPLANFLNNLGLDIVKQSVYQEAIHIQSRKQQASKLSETECSQLDKMRASCKELTSKLHHLKLSYRKCKLCNFVSESVNVHFWHREHPHINKREDLCCSYCDFVTRNNVAFNFHMEAEHNIKGRSMDKPSFWQCTLCPFEHNSKTKLTQHKFKCEKIFELKTHLAPSPETDINYSLYGVFYLSEKEEALKAIALHKAKQAQLKAQQAQYKLQQQQAAANRANYFNANKISPMQQNQGNMNQRYPLMVHSKPHGTGMQSPNQMQGNQTRSNCYQHQSHIRSPMVRPPTPAMKQFTPGRGNMVQNHYRGSSIANQGVNNNNLMHSRLPVKDLINMNQSGKNQNMMSSRTVSSQKYVPNSHANDVSAFETCELCNGYVKDRNALRIHLFYAHKVEMPALMFEKPNPPLFCDVCDRKFWTSQGLQKHRVLLKHYAKGSLSQVCIVCGCQVTHLLNHMTNTHQINLQDFLNQKRCIVCGIVCQSRSGTEIHMASSHGILVKHSGTNSYDITKKCTTPQYNMPNKGGYTPSPTQTKGHYCMFCKVPFPTSMELNRHRLLAHKSCSRCSMVLPNAQALAHHKCQMRVLTKKVCKVCKQQIPLSNFIRHVQERHLKKYKVSLKRVSSEQINSGIKEKVIHVDLTDEPSSPTSQDDETPKVRSLPPNFTLPKQKFDPLRMKRKRPLDPEEYYPTVNSTASAASQETSEGGADSSESKKGDSCNDANDFQNKSAEEKSCASR